MKFLFVSQEALAGDLAWQVKKEGHKSKYFIEDKEQKDVCDGFVDKSEDWKADIDWADVIVFDDTLGFGKVAEKLRKDGKLVVGGTAYTDRLEDDREFGQEEMKSVGMNILPNWNFTDFDGAIKFLKENPGRYVIKPNGLAANEKELLYVGQDDDGIDVLQVLEHYKKTWAKKIKSFQLQKFASGVEVAVGAFFNGRDFIKPIYVNFEHKRLFPGELGPGTGEMGTAAFFSPPNFLFNATLAKMKNKLAEQGYVGYIDLNCIANANGIYPLEFTARFGFPTVSLQMEGFMSPWGEFLHAIASGQDYELKTKKGFQICIVVAVPPFPFYDKESFEKYSKEAVVIFKKDKMDGVHLGDVKLVETEMVLAGMSGYALIITGAGNTMEAARNQAYRRIENIMLPNMFYRTDIGLRWIHDSDKLHTWGYLY
ncbi:MAG: phosphoribosylamine--glycine ligase [Candidatus Aenigmarchaeota archaeon]|nr:phosphoribosylamine--glycine ligase [Candidatus Aenigmarchaeota archaeon]